MLEGSYSSDISGCIRPGGSIIFARSHVGDAAGCGMSKNMSNTQVVVSDCVIEVFGGVGRRRRLCLCF